MNNIRFIYNDSSAFSFAEGSADVPISIEPAYWHDLKINFTPPDTGNYNATIKINTNITNSDSVGIITLSGIGIHDTTGVEDYTAFAENGLFLMEAVPNPVQGHAFIQYTLKGEKTENVLMYMVDVRGREVAKLVNNPVAPGKYGMSLDASALNLSSGSYFIIADVGSSQARLPIVIIR